MSYKFGMRGLEVCTTVMCDDAKVSVDEMNLTYQAAGSPIQFKASVETINAAFNENFSFYSDLIPFNPACCALQGIGVQADALTKQMNAGLPGKPPHDPLDLSFGLGNTLMIVGALAIGLMVYTNRPR
jgi:hypothetical protein